MTGIKYRSSLAVEIVEEVGTEKPSIPRMCNRQTQRFNVEADLPECITEDH